MALIRRLSEPPRLRTLGEDETRRSTWLELFFDLVFVVAVAQLGQQLSLDVSAEGLFRFLGFFVPVWWAWMGFTFYANRFDTDDLPYRLLTLVGMFAIAALATTVPGAFAGATVGFPLAYVGARVVLLVLYARAARHVPEARKLARMFLTAFGAAVAIWLVSLAFPRPWNYILWGCALAIELAIPFFTWRQIRDAPIHPRHIPERFGLLTLIVLGESVLGVVLGVEKVSWVSGSALAATAGFITAAALWWIYFDFLDETTIGSRGLLSGLTFTYMHFFIVVGLAALGAGVKMAILAAGGDHHYDETAWVLCAGLAMTMFGLAAIELVAPPVLFDVDFVLRIGTAAFALILVPFDMAPLTVLVLLAAVLLAQVVFELARHDTHARLLES
jgi:low temperature requirement protein LtrA